MGRPQLPRLEPFQDADGIHVPLPHGRFALVDPIDEWTLGIVWYCTVGRAATSTKPPIHMHRMIADRMGFAPDSKVDHANRTPLDNRRANLRVANMSLNSANRVKDNPRSTSIYKGVGMHKASGLWRARIKVNGVDTVLGYYHSETEAAAVYNVAARQAFGEFAVLNEL